ncbi:MAG TPA: BlaI/MecI/CopY family transcriptional regulator [Acidobacteriota bacterium]|jgi:predicted transcriptional regulator|nr:BlaI/MecI/CopY family transcriptional regulator [Blastocatellia bacterium]
MSAKKLAQPDLSRRERQILDALYRAGSATAAEVRQAIPRAPSYSAVRTLLRILEDKGHVRHEEEGTRYVYRPVIERERAKGSALRHVLNTFFEGSTTQAIVALLHEDSKQLSAEDWDRLAEMIERARKEGM